MLAPQISVTLEAVNSIKNELTKTLPQVKSSHRVESLARGLGFLTYSSMLAHAKARSHALAKLNWDKIASYLKDHKLSAKAEPYYMAVGRVAMQQTLDIDKDITVYGFSMLPEKGADGKRESKEEYILRFDEARKELISDRCIGQFLRGLDLVGGFKKIKTMSKKANTSYGIKHIAENRVCFYPDGEPLGPEYVSNGALIAAAINAGFIYNTHGEILNVVFNMSQKSINEAIERNNLGRKLGDGTTW